MQCYIVFVRMLPVNNSVEPIVKENILAVAQRKCVDVR